MTRLPMILAMVGAAAASTLFAQDSQEGGPELDPSQIPPPPYEFRGAWIASAYNIDWPSRPGLQSKTQQKELRELLDRAAALNLNAVLLQVRPAADALYRSEEEPWSAFLSSREGRDPRYDPLAFAVQEAHRRGLELHAWFNPFRASTSTTAGHDSKHISQKRWSAVRKYRGQLWMDPGDPWVRDYVLGIIKDVTARYDIDGVHIDDYFYPYPPQGEQTDFPDDETYKEHGKGMDRDEWRRQNINTFVSALYRTVKATKPGVKVGISPFGIWRPDNPEGIEADLDAYAHIYADSKLWLSNGWCDYFSPQLYWRIKPEEQSFTALLEWWNEQNTRGRQLWPGIATSRIDSKEDPGRPAVEIAAQVDATRELITSSVPGQVHWSLSALADNRGGIAKLLGAKQYATKALVPPVSGTGGRVHRRPILTGRSPSEFSWFPVEQKDEAQPRWWCIQTYTNGQWKFVDLVPADTLRYTINQQRDVTSVRGVAADGTLGTPSVIAHGRFQIPKAWFYPKADAAVR